MLISKMFAFMIKKKIIHVSWAAPCLWRVRVIRPYQKTEKMTHVECIIIFNENQSLISLTNITCMTNMKYIIKKGKLLSDFLL